MPIPVILAAGAGYVAKGVAMYVGEKVLVNSLKRVMQGTLIDDLKSGKALNDIVQSAKDMAMNPLDTAWEGVKSKVTLGLASKLGTGGQIALSVATDAVFPSEKSEKISSMKMKV